MIDIIQEQFIKNLSGIYRDKTMDYKLKYIPNDDTQNYSFCRLQLVTETLEHWT